MFAAWTMRRSDGRSNRLQGRPTAVAPAVCEGRRHVLCAGGRGKVCSDSPPASSDELESESWDAVFASFRGFTGK